MIRFQVSFWKLYQLVYHQFLLHTQNFCRTLDQGTSCKPTVLLRNMFFLPGQQHTGHPLLDALGARRTAAHIP